MGFVLLWLLCAVIGSMIGKRKGAEGIGFLLGLLFGPFGILIVVFMEGDRRPCPRCTELIHRDAQVCPKCQHQFVAAPTLAPPPAATKPTSVVNEERINCRNCGESIPLVARQCRFCQTPLVAEEDVPQDVEPTAPLQTEVAALEPEIVADAASPGSSLAWPSAFGSSFGGDSAPRRAEPVVPRYVEPPTSGAWGAALVLGGVGVIVLLFVLVQRTDTPPGQAAPVSAVSAQQAGKPDSAPSPSVVPAVVRATPSLHIAYADVMRDLGDFSMVVGSTADGRPRRHGRSANELMLLEVIGPSQNVAEATLLAGVANDRPASSVEALVALTTLANNLGGKAAAQWVARAIPDVTDDGKPTRSFAGRRFTLSKTAGVGIMLMVDPR